MVHFLPHDFLKTSGMYPSGEIMLDTFSFLHCRLSGVVLNSRIIIKIQTLPQCCIFAQTHTHTNILYTLHLIVGRKTRDSNEIQQSF